MNALCYNEACTKDFHNLWQDLNLAEAAGFDFIEMRFDLIEEFLNQGGSFLMIKDFFEKSHIKPHALNALYIYPEFLSKNARKKVDDELFSKLRLLQTLYEECGVSRCIVVSPLLPSFQETLSYQKEQVHDDVVRILSFLHDKYPQIEWIFEPVGLKRSLVKDVSSAAAIIRDVGSRKVGLVLDAYNLYLNDLKSDYNFKFLLPWEIKAVHAMNAISSPKGEIIVDQRFRRFLDDGDALDANLFLREILATGYGGMISTEVFYPGYAQSLTAGSIVKKAYASLYKALNSCV